MNIGYYAHDHGSGHCRQADKLARLYTSITDNYTNKNVNDNVSNNVSNNVDGSGNDSVINIDNDSFDDNVKSNVDDKAPASLTVFTSMPKTDYTFNFIDNNHIVYLPPAHEREDDLLPGRAGAHWQPSCLHYSPVGNQSIKQRSSLILNEVLARDIQLMIVDLSVEIALLCRTASVPYLYVRLPGKRDDAPHLNAFEGAMGLLAFYPKTLESADTPQWVQDKTLYVGFSPPTLSRNGTKPFLSKTDFISKISNVSDTKENKSNFNVSLSDDSSIVTVIKGFGGHKNIDDELVDLLPQLRRVLPNAYVVSLGPITDEAIPYVDVATQVVDVTPFLAHSTVLVVACGLNAIGEACQFNTPLVVIPDVRPHDEQEMMAQALIDCGRGLSIQTVMGINSATISGSDLDITQPIDNQLVTSLKQSQHLAFVKSLVEYAKVKDWLEHWLLPKLSIKAPILK